MREVKKEMTREEAIEELEVAKGIVEQDGKDYFDERDIPVLDMAIEALRMPVPKQYGWVCPICGRGLSPFTVVCPCNNGKGWEITC